MVGRDPEEGERSGSGLEVFYDLIFVVLFSFAGLQLAENLAEGRYFTATFGYLITTFGAIWACIYFAWFASSFDTDDAWFRLSTFVQMVGVAIMAVGIPPVFASIEAEVHVDVRVLVFGYMVMRLGLIPQWLRAAFQSNDCRSACLTYAATSSVAQLGWIAVALLPMDLRTTLIAIAVCAVVEFAGPFVAERFVHPTPWNPFHIAERYATLTTVTLGEGVVATVVLLQAQIADSGWTVQTGLLGAVALGVTFAMWWLYSVLPNGENLARNRQRCFVWGYLSVPLFMACAAVGSGLHVFALWIEDEAHVSETEVLASVAVPLGLFTIGAIFLHFYVRGLGTLCAVLVVGALVPIGAGFLAAALGAPMFVSLIILCLSPVVPLLLIELNRDLEVVNE